MTDEEKRAEIVLLEALQAFYRARFFVALYEWTKVRLAALRSGHES
jgi:hypothetical protein